MVGAGNSFSFSPQTVNINVGDTVTWNWVSTTIPHTVTSGAPGAADGKFCSVPAGTPMNATTCNSASYAQTAPASFSQTFSTAGTFPYFCEIHGAMMTGTVVVAAAAAPGGGGGGGGGGTGGTGGTGGGGGAY
jgi:plastocyanin